ncbi:MAG: undecaprenyl-diphosphate phosphatase [Anaerolineaceae bacterium]|nr:undecaprenyl-diphosphate phosphatase [Anaerolineaceae bacterium]
MLELIKVIILGIVEGLTEFLPISSTGHLIVFAALLDFKNANGSTFEIFIQIGAVVAVIVFFRAELLKQVATVTSDKEVQRLWLNIAIAFLPAAIIGFIFADKIDELLFRPVVVAASLIVGGIIFLVVERRPNTSPLTTSLASITPRQALAVGVAQISALIPGVSRSGSTIIGGMLFGLDRAVATKFSFYLAIPTLGIATLYSLIKSLKTIQGNDLVNLILGAIVAGIVAWIAVRWLLNYVARNSFVAFGYYRMLAGIIIIILIIMNVLPA